MMPVIIQWYPTAEDYEAILALVPASESKNADAYPAWVKRMESFEEAQRHAGMTVQRFNIKAEAVKVWCDQKGWPVCRSTIREFAHTKIAESLGAEWQGFKPTHDGP